MKGKQVFTSQSAVEEANTVAELQTWLMNINSDNLEETKQKILDSIFVTSPKRIDQLVSNIFLASEVRPFSTRYICNLCQHLINSIESNENLSSMKAHLMHSLSRPPTRHSAHLYLLRQLMYHSCISAQDIIFELNRFLKSHPDRIEDTLSTFCVFAPEIEHNDKPLFDSILTQFKTMCTGKYAGYLPPELDLFIDQLESLRANNWKLLIQRADYGFNNDPISITLKDDDIETLREMSKSPYFDKNQRIHPSVFERCMFLWNEPTLLQFAAFHGAVNCFKYLIELGSDLTILSRNNFDVSCFAVAGGNLNIIKILEEKGITFKDAIQISAAMHQHNIFHWLYKNKCPNGLTDIGSELDSVLHAAAGANNTRLMLFCIGKKVDVNIKGRTLLSPLHIATERSRMDSISLLLAHKGLNINACDENEETALHVAAENGRYKPMKLLVSHEDINVNSRDKFGKTPLHFASQEGYSKAIKILLNQPDIKVNALDDERCAPIHFAAQNGRSDAIKILLTHPDIDVNIRDIKGWTPLHYAVQHNHPQVLRYLLAHNDVDINCRNNEGWTPLHFAIRPEENLEIIQILLNDNRIDVNLCYDDGWSPLHMAVEMNLIDVVKLLLKKESIDTKIKYKGKTTPLEIANEQNFVEIAKLISDHDKEMENKM